MGIAFKEIKMENLPEWKYVGIVPGLEEEISCSEVSSSMVYRFKGFEEIKIPNLKTSMHKSALYQSINSNLCLEEKRIMATVGHGSYHHLTYGLCRLADRLSKDYLYIHIDHHIDSWRREFQLAENTVLCNNFVPYILEDTHASSALILGDDIESIMSNKNCSHAKKLLEEKGCKCLKERTFGGLKIKHIEKYLESIKTEDVYVTFDLDVMYPSEVSTGYKRGRLSKKNILKTIKAIKKHKRIIGADVTGYSAESKDKAHMRDYISPMFKDDKVKERSMKLYEDIIRLVTE